MDHKQKLGLCMIVKDEENNLRRCLDSVAHIVDEMIIVDTGSSDRTVDIAGEFGADIYHYSWSNDFSAARNYSIEQCNADWLLLLDADEELDQSAADQLISFLSTEDCDGAHFAIYNFMGDAVSNQITIHAGLRLLRNNKKYHFIGEIHEQVARIDGGEIDHKFPVLEIRVNHYGYMDGEVNSKQKRNRNIPILKQKLERDPNHPFTLFNLGNEYLALNDFITALEFYEKALEGVNPKEAFAPHLFFRIANCHDHLKQYEKALYYLDQSLRLYPKGTDFVYVKGCILMKLKQYSLAIDALKSCLELGEAPLAIRFLNDCGTYRPALALGELFLELSDFNRALEYYNKALLSHPEEVTLLYRIAEIQNQMYQDKDLVARNLMEYFADKKHAPNVILAADILINEKLYDQALMLLEDAEAKPQNKVKYWLELNFLKGKIYFFMEIRMKYLRPLFRKYQMKVSNTSS